MSLHMNDLTSSSLLDHPLKSEVIFCSSALQVHIQSSLRNLNSFVFNTLRIKIL